jgi:iron complex outermembrane receptor protein
VAPADLKQLSIEQLMEIDVTSVSRRSERLSQAAAAITVITGEDLRRSGVTNLPDALRLSVSMHVAQSDGHTWAITARGFNSSFATADKLLVLIDGRSVYTPLFSGVFWDVQDVLLEDVDRIEVIRGPGATLWGANAVNGVINIITKSAKVTQGGLVTAGAGTETDLGSLRWGGKLGEGTYYRAYGKYYSRSALDLAVGGNRGSAHDPLRRTQGGFRVDRDASDGAGALIFQGDVYNGGYSEAIRSDDTNLDGGNLLGRWKRTLSADSGMDLQVYFDRSHRRTPNYFEEHRDTVDVDFQRRLPVGRRHDVVWGLGSRVTRDEVTNSPGVAFIPDHRTFNLFSVFAQDEIALVPDRLRLTLGTKLEYTESTGLEMQPSVRAAWTPDDRHTLWAAVSRAVRTPTRFDEDVVFLTVEGDPLLSGTRDFKSEELLAYELGFRFQPTPDLLVDAASFYDVYDHLRTFEPVAGTPAFVFGNELEAEAWGIELRSSWQPASWWRLHAGYVWFGKRLRLTPESGDPTGGRLSGDDPRNRYSLRSVMDLPGGFELDGWLRYVGELPSPAVRAYTEMDLRLGWRRERLELSLTGQNLLHAHHVEFAPSPVREAVQRSVLGKVTWHF